VSGLVDGRWQRNTYRPRTKEGAFARADARFRDWVCADGTSPFPPEKDRYHLYVSFACPWAHRALIFRTLKALEDVISVSVVDPVMGPDGWVFSNHPGSTLDTVNGCQYLHQVYALADATYSGSVTVPVLWDKRNGTIVNNESSEIIRMFNTEFNEFGNAELNFYPPTLRSEIDEINRLIYNNVNNGVYRAGFASTQEAYDKAFHALFGTLDELERRLASRRYLLGAQLTEADWRLFTTLVRFDSVYYGHFKCNARRLADYPNLWGYVR